MIHTSTHPTRKIWFSQTIFCTVMLIFTVMHCNLPTDPCIPSNSNVTLQLKSSIDRDFSNNTYDSAGITIGIRLNLKYPEFIDTIKLKIIDTVADTKYFDTSIIIISKLTADTLSFTYKLVNIGYHLFIATATIEDRTTRSDTATCTVLGSMGSKTENHVPHLSITDSNRTVIAGDLCTLTVKITDEDPGQTHTVIASQEKQTVTLQGNQHVWRVPANATGEQKLLFIVTDNGNPPQSSSRNVILPVSYKTPEPPANLHVTSRDEKGLTLSWDGSPRATYYAVYKAENQTSEFKLYADSLTSPTFTDKNYTESSTYYVKAFNSAGISEPAKSVSSTENVNTAPQWAKPDTIKVTLAPGTPYTLELAPLCSDAQNDKFTFALVQDTFTGDAISGTTYTSSVATPITGTVTVSIIAQDPKGLSDTLYIAFTGTTVPENPSAGDTTGPVILLVSPSKDSSIIAVNKTTIEITVTDQSGIASVTCSIKDKPITVSKVAGNRYSVDVHDLVAGVNTLSFIATDSSSNNNKRSFSATVIFYLDQTKPALILTSPTPYSEGMRVTTPNGSIAFTANDESGIDSAYYTINNGARTNITGVNGTYSFLYSLQQSGLATITVVVVDASTAHNQSSISIIVNYNATLPPAISLGTPVNNADDIPTLTPFTWTALSDADNDSIYYRVEYSTLSDVTKSTLSPEITTDNWTIGSNDILSNETRYYYRVIGYTKAPYQDTVRSGIRSFITEKKRLWVVTNSTLTDPDGNTYTTVTIGSQVWTIENLGTTKYNDGTAIPHVLDDTAWAGLSTPAYCWYDNSTDSGEQKKWGALYNWHTVNTGKLAPEGWRVPTDADWDTLMNYLIANGYNYDGTTTGNKIGKSLAAKTDWIRDTAAGAIGNDLSQNNASRFSALPGGCREGSDGFYGFYYQGYNGHWWSATEGGASGAYGRRLDFGSEYLGLINRDKSWGFSVRLLRD